MRAFRTSTYGSNKRDDSYDERDLIDCSAFENLGQIDVEARMLLKPQDKHNRQAVVDRLPRSLQRLYLTYSHEHSLEYERDSLRALENPKTAQLPDLRLLQVNTYQPRTAKRIAESLNGGNERLGLDYIVCGGEFERIFHAVNDGDHADN